MAQSRPSVLKRQRERARMEKKRTKAERKATRDAEKAERDEGEEEVVVGTDPDIAHIVPGPQPLPEHFSYGGEGEE